MTDPIYTIYDSPGNVIYTNSIKFPAKYVVVTRKKTLMLVSVNGDGSYNPLIRVSADIVDAINYLD